MMEKPPPPLPPRGRSDTIRQSPYGEAPPPYAETDDHTHPLHVLATHDPRSSSTQSLVPAEGQAQRGRRKLLLVYIHGFMGDETSFQSFPAHVHNLVTVTLSETHVVHTKIYPKYRARNTIEYATEQFSRWLTPHADADTDIILLGHSMGGLVSAEVVLLPPHGPAAFVGQAFRHRILGIINFDVPFLGMHPGIISAGLSSIFRPAEDKSPEHNPQPAEQSYHPSAHSSVSTLDLGPPLRNDTLFNTNPNDPNYNPRFDNDVILPVRKGWENALHFIAKHSDGLVQASRQYVKSHLEFGGTMADYPGLNKRYKRVRALEEEDETKRRAAVAVVGRNPPSVPRVRFVNFYTASTGRPKKAKTPEPGVASNDFGMSDLSLASSSQDPRLSVSHSQSISPRISVEEHGDDERLSMQVSPKEELRQLSPAPLSDHDLTPTHSLNQESSEAASISLSGIPEPPVEPPLPDLEACPDAESRKAAMKQHEHALKDYKRAVKDRNALIKQRSKEAEKLAKEAKKEEKRKAKEAKAREEKEQAKKAQPESQKSGEELRLEKERQRLEAESQRMAEAERERMKVQRKMLGLPPEEESPEVVQEEKQAEPVEHEEPTSPEPSRFRSESPSTSLSPAHHRRESSQASSLHRRESSQASSYHRRGSSQATSCHRRESSEATSLRRRESSQATPGKKKDRKFCVLPSKDPRTGQRDPAWIRVFMEGFDEVGAHCGLFFVGETYERLVGEVAEKIERWVLEDVSERAVRELESQVI